ncbi:type I restriction endonuclease subunit R [Bacteroides sp. AN502(2024)]|uniref:type I restriction endonuclease subunit R n=1 Tax=Bacteroides sp. AN502(2024) TaxID=3160599 RepID=UPI00351386DF
MSVLNETFFEKHIADYLADSPLYNQRTAADFDIDALCDRDMLRRFIEAQTPKWQRLVQRFGSEDAAFEAVVKEYNNRIDKGAKLSHLLIKGLNIQGIKLKLVQFKPEYDDAESEFQQLYMQNRFSVVRQMRYSNMPPDNKNEIDLAILVNGIPIITAELKNEQTDQTYVNAIHQYRTDRNPQNRLLKTILVHFAVDNNYAFMTTTLRGEATTFLPFNINSKNPAVESDYPTCYMWKEIWQADSLLNILQHFIKQYKERDEKTGKEKDVTIFPRYHQLRAVRNLCNWARENGAGKNYLIEHAAGSGKTKSMAWLAHQLANITDRDTRSIFDSIIMVTDRIVLNANMAEDVNHFETEAGTVADIRRGSRKLADAINDGNRIIVSTVQKFGYALDHLKRDKARRYAIIVDEAHTAIGNESAKDLVNALSTDEELRNYAERFGADDYASEMDAMLAFLQAMRQEMSHISYFAFTATPKDKTYALFGYKNTEGKWRAHDYYSMKQAIEEKFILDVLQNYTTYDTMYEYIAKSGLPEDEASKEYEERKAVRLILQALNKDPYNMEKKARVMLAHFFSSSIHKIGGQAKAMVVSDSRLSAVRYKQIIDKIIAEDYNGVIKTLVAFSGTVELDGVSYTEDKMNGYGIKDNRIRDIFNEPEYRILIVADKFQTGFDQKLLHTMYVDKMLGGIQCIQTLSRLNRCFPPLKEDTMVLDFRNRADDVLKAFQRYYKETELQGDVDVQRLYSFVNEIEQYKVYNDAEEENIVRALLNRTTAASVPSMVKRIVDERVEPMADADKDKFRKLINRYIRSYGFMAQLMKFIDPDLERHYVFYKVLYKALPYTKETLPMEILEKVDLNKFRLQMSFEGNLQLEDEDTTLQSSRIGDINTPRADETKTLQELLNIVNEPWEGYLDENDKIIRNIVDELQVDTDLINAFRANNSPESLSRLIIDKIMTKAGGQIDKFFSLLTEVHAGSNFSKEFVRGVADLLARNTQADRNLPLDINALHQAICNVMDGTFAELYRYIRPLAEVVSTLLKVIQAPSISNLDGINDIVMDSLNQVYRAQNLRLVDRRRHFNSLVSHYEPFLKKLYYLMNGQQIEAPEEGRNATFKDAVFAFRALRGLRNNPQPVYQQFSQYLENLRQWRNTEAHEANTATEQDLIGATHIVVAMYIYIVSQVTTELEMSEYYNN